MDKDNEDGNEDLHLPLGGIIGITVGGVFIIMCLIIYLIIKMQSNKKKRSSALLQEHKMLRTLSTKNGTLSLSYRKSDEEDNLRPISGESKTSFQFDANAMRSRDNTGRISYDTPFSVLQKLESDQAEVQKRNLENGGVRSSRVVTNYGPVSMVSTGYFSGYYDAESVQNYASVFPPPPEEDGFVNQGQGQSGQLPDYSPYPDTQVREPGYRVDSFRSSVGVDLGADIEKANRIIN